MQKRLRQICKKYTVVLKTYPEKQLGHTEKKDGARTVPFGNRFDKLCPF